MFVTFFILHLIHSSKFLLSLLKLTKLNPFIIEKVITRFVKKQWDVTLLVEMDKRTYPENLLQMPREWPNCQRNHSTDSRLHGAEESVLSNEEQIISSCPIDGAILVRVDGSFGSYRWFVYITTLLLRDASWILILHCGPSKPPQRHLYLLVLLEPHSPTVSPSFKHSF